MKFIVECACCTAEMIVASGHPNTTDNYIGEYIEADTAEEAIESAMDYIAEKINETCDYSAEIEGDSVKVYDDAEVVEEYYRFQAVAA